jgi:predicted RNase H-like HicB family nuclease
MSKPNYRATVTFDPDRKLFLARAPELEHCTAEGATRAEAVAKLEEEIDAQLANMLSHGSTPPRAVDEETFTGEVSAKVSKLLHRDLVYQARSEGIDLDHLVGELLAAAMEGRKQSHRGMRGGNRAAQEHAPSDNLGNRYEGGGRPQRGFGGRGHNTHLLDDRANFIEYVRGLEQQGNRGHGGGGGGQHGGRGGGRDRRRGRGGPPHGQGRGPQGNGGARGLNGGGNGGAHPAGEAKVAPPTPDSGNEPNGNA